MIGGDKMNDADMTKDEMIEEMIGQRVQVNAEWLEENDQDLLEWVVSRNYWNRGPNRDTALVEIQFTEEEIQYTVTTTDDDVAKAIANQEPWGCDIWDDWDKEDVELYYNLLN